MLGKKYLLLFSLLTCHHSQAASIQPGDLFISEIMANPSAVSDANGEWFELFNASANPIDLNGLTISDDTSNTHTIDSGGSLFIASGEYFVLGRNGDTLINGGYIADYVYTGFSLGNTNDQIIISENGAELSRVNYTGLPFGTAGISVELIIQAFPLNESSYQLTQNSFYGDGDIGTPGTQGSFALTHATTVPIPGAIWLFASVALLGLSRLNRQREQTPKPFYLQESPTSC